MNWSKTEAVLRSLLLLGASVFVGGIVLPLTAEGTLPVTWAAWRPVLAVAATAAIVAEVTWIRSHLAALAAQLGLSSGGPPATPAETPSAKRIQGGGFAAPELLLAVSVAAVSFATGYFSACTGPEARAVDTVAIDLTNAVCSAVEGQPAGQPWVDIVCAVATSTEQGIATLLADGGALAMSAPVRVVHLRLAPDQASAFLAAHPSH